MRSPKTRTQGIGPVAIGGIGGSGTRVGAAMLQSLGFHIGDDLNGPLDNLWFTLLFKRRSVLTLTRSQFSELASAFWARMSGSRPLTDAEAGLVRDAVNERLQHDPAWLAERATSFLSPDRRGAPVDAWGWKEPNTHIVLERLMEFDHELKYLHFFRHPLDMAFSENQFQPQNWGPVFLNRDVPSTPENSLRYWCCAHQRIERIARDHPGRVLLVNFDTLAAEPIQATGRITKFLGLKLAADDASRATRVVDGERPVRGRHAHYDISRFPPAEMSYVRSLGFEI